MLERKLPFVLSEQAKEDGEVAVWAWNSHWWVEQNTYGHYVCKWCGAFVPGAARITKDNELCRGNYAVKRLLEALGNKLMEEESGTPQNKE